MRSMATRNGDISNGTLFAAVLIVSTLALTVSAWDEKDLAELRAQATATKETALRVAVEQSGHTGWYSSEKHCRVPGKGERLEMTLAQPGEPGNGYRCTFWERSLPGYAMRATTTYSRSHERRLPDRAGGRP